MKSEITDFARGLKCGGFSAYGLSPSGLAAQASETSAASSPCDSSMCASATPLIPPPARHRNSRRDQKYFMLCTASPHVKEFAEVQQNVSEINQRTGLHLLERERALQIGRGSSERQLVTEIDLFRGVVRYLTLDSLGKEFGLLNHERVVEQRQRLRRHHRHVAGPCGQIHIRMIEGLEHRIWQRAPLIDVDTPPPCGRTVGLVVPAPLGLFGHQDFLRHVWEKCLSAHRQVDVAGDREHRIANRLGIEALRTIPP